MLKKNQISDTYKPVLNHLESAKNRIIQDCSSAAKHPVVTGNTFISQEFEFRFILKFCAFALLGGLVFTSMILFYCNGSLTTSFDGARLVIKQTSLMVLPGVLYTNLIMLFLAVMICIILTFYLSYCIRKPLFRFREDIHAIANGDMTKNIQYRGRDLARSLAQNINLMTSNFYTKICEVETELRQIIEDAPDKNIPDELLMELIQLQRSIKESFIL